MRYCAGRPYMRPAALLVLLGGLSALAARGGQEPAGQGVAMISAEGEGAKYWPRWRGPSGQGVVPDGDYPDAWSDTENVLWKVEVPGRGNSSPILWKDRLF